jgi:hypothetical protein
MNPLARLLLVPALLLCPLRTAAAADETIQFKKGATSATVRGTVVRFNKTYVFRARQGQNVTLTLAPDGGDKGMLTLSLYAYCGEAYGRPLVDDTLRWQGALPCSDRYSIDVKASDEAQRDARALGYALTLSIR